MKMTCQTSDYQLTLGDLRRLVSETALWPDKCRVVVFTSNSIDRITVEETENDRKPKTAPAAKVVKAAAK